MFDLEDLPNELLLMIFSYISQLELSQSFLQLNQRFTNLLIPYFRHWNLSSKFEQKKLNRLFINYFPLLNNFVSSLTIDNEHIGREFLEKTKSIPFENFSYLQLIDNAIELTEDFIEKFSPECLKLVQTPFYQENKRDYFLPKSIKDLSLHFHIEYDTEKYRSFDQRIFLNILFDFSCLFNQLNVPLTSILFDLRLSFSKLSLYFQLFRSSLIISIKKLSLSIFSIDSIDLNQMKIIDLPSLTDFQLEICFISFDLLKFVLPSNKNNQLNRFAFTGQTTNRNAFAWKSLLMNKYQMIEQFHLQFFNVSSIDFEQWKFNFPQHFFEFDSMKNLFRICSSKFDQLQRISLNESVEDLTHIDYPKKISHLIVRSEYCCSYFHLSSKIQNDLIQRFLSIRRLSINYQQLKSFLQTNFLQQIEELDLEFAEQYCLIESKIAEEFLHLKSIRFSSMYQGIHQLNLHSTIKDLLLNKFPQIHFLSIDSIEILDDLNIEQSIVHWFSSKISFSYIKGKSFSIWF